VSTKYATLAAEERYLVVPGVDFPEMARRYHEEKDATWQPSTRKLFTRLTPFTDWIGSRQLTPELLDEFVAYCRAIGRHDTKTLIQAKRVYTWAIRKGYAKGNPFYKWKMPKTTKPRPHRAVSHDDFIKVSTAMRSSSKTVYAAMVVCYETAMDWADCQSLRWSMVDMETLTITRVRKKMETRHDKTYTTQIDPAGMAYEVIMGRHKHRKPGVDVVFPDLQSPNKGRCSCTLIADVCRKMGLQPFTFHDLRFTRITAMVSAGIPPHVVMKVSGHSTPEMLYHYVGVSPSAAGSAVVQSVGHSRICPDQQPSTLQQVRPLPSRSAPTRPSISSASTLPRVAGSLESQSPSSSPTITPPTRSPFVIWREKRDARIREAAIAAATARETGRLSSTDASSPEAVGRTLQSS